MPTHALVNDGTTDITVAVYQRKIRLTDAQIKALPSTPVELLPSPGAGKSILVSAVVYTISFSGSGTGYTGASADAELYITGADNLIQLVNGNAPALTYFLNAIELSSFNKATVRISSRRTQNDDNAGVVSDPAANYTQYANKPLRLEAYDSVASEWLGGNSGNYLEVTVLYSIVDL